MGLTARALATTAVLMLLLASVHRYHRQFVPLPTGPMPAVTVP